MSKVFELKPYLDSSSGSKVESLAFSEGVLYLGTSDGYLRQYATEGDSLVLDAEKRLAENLPVSFIRVASALNKLLLLCDSSLMVLSMSIAEELNLSKSVRMKGVSCITVNENPKYDDPFAIQICAAKKKLLIICKLTEGNLSVEKTKNLSEPISALAMNGAHVCVALSSKYIIFNSETGDIQEVFAFGSDVFPCIALISKEEFLLNAQIGLGACATSEGIANRPPIQWLSPVNKFIHFDPYVITLSPDVISVYSLLDYDQKQVIAFSGGRLIGNYDGRIFLASSSSIYQLQPIPIDKRIEMLLANENVDEALSLIENESARRRIDEAFEKLLRLTKIRAGFIFFKKFKLDRAKDMFKGAEMDPRELISLYPGYLPENSRFVREVPSLHDIADVNLIVKGDKEKLASLKDFLRSFLEETIERHTVLQNGDCLMESNLALLRLLALSDSCDDTFISFVRNPNVRLELNEAKRILTESGRHHALACLLKRNGSIHEALKLWVALIQENLRDDTFPGFAHFTQELMTVPEEHLWNFADFALAKDQEAIVNIFKHKSLANQIDDKRVLNFLNKYPKAHLLFLEHLVLQKRVEVESFHSQLAIRYLELIDMKQEEDELLEKFRSLIMTSDHIKPQFLLSRLEKTELHRERAILYGKMGEYNKALQILVKKLKDFDSAEQYCDDMARNTSSPKAELQKFLSALLKIYIEDSTQGDLPVSTPIALVNRRSHEMHPVELLRTLPPNWSIDVVDVALRKSIRSTIHEKRMGNVGVGLSRGENMEVKFKLLQLLRRPFVIEANAHCVVCKKSFHGSSSNTRFPNGVTVHSTCVKSDNTCPYTGEIFH